MKDKSELAKDQTTSDASVKTKLSKKRKRTTCDALLGESPTTVEPGHRKKKKHENCTPYPDPTSDESLSEQSRRALSYAYKRCRRVEHWKFNKARQNWLLRNIWSEQAVPGTYVPLVIEYLIGIRGGAREKLIALCTLKLSTSYDEPIQQSAEPFDGGTEVGSTAGQQPSTSRALSILNALRENSQNHEFN